MRKLIIAAALAAAVAGGTQASAQVLRSTTECKGDPCTYLKEEAAKAEHRRASGYRDPPGSYSLCPKPHRMTDNGCQ